MSDVRTDGLDGRYGSPSPSRRRALVGVSALVAVLALAWLAWAAWFQGTPDVQSSLRSFDVVDTHTVRTSVIVQPRSSEVSATCLVRAFGEDHSVVGELNFRVNGVDGATTRAVEVRTEREATSVELVGCTTANQSRPR